MIHETDNSAYYPEQQNTFDIKIFLFRIIRKWHWFAIFISIGLFTAWLYNLYMPSEYSIHSSMIVNEYESGIKSLTLSPESPYAQRDVNVLGQDHAGRLRSHMLNLNALRSLGWNISWYQKTLLYDKDLYGNEPFNVILNSNKTNLTDVPVSVRQISDSEFLVNVESTMGSNSIIPVKFSNKARFGELFENSYFSFTLEKLNNQFISGKDIYFVINNLNTLANQYQNKLKVISNEKKPDIMELILSENNPQRGVDFLNRLEQTYSEFGLTEKNSVAKNTINFIDSQLKSVVDSLSHSENRFANFRAKTQSVDINQEGGMVMQKQETLESERAVLESRIKYLRNLLNEMNDSRQMQQVVVPSVFGITDQTLNNLVSKLSDLYSKREVQSLTVRDKAPSLLMLDKEIQYTHNMLAQNINSLLISTESDLANLIRRAGGFSNQLTLLPRTEQQLNSLKRSFDLNNELYTYLLKKRAESAITLSSNQPDVKVLDPPGIETVKLTSPMTMVNYFVGIILGFLVPFSIILFNDFIKGFIQSREEIEAMTKLPVVGTIIHNKSKKDLIVLENPHSNITESFRLLRTNLKFILNEKDKKVIAVQSTIAGEGKSFVSANLASILAMNNLKVLLVSVDMRMSTVHKILKSQNKIGLSTYLSNQDNFEDIIEDTPINNLSYIPSGPVPPNPAELLENGNFDRFIEEAKSRFDYIVLDNPPVAVVTDGIIAGRYAHLNLFVIRFRFSSKEQIKLINELESKKTIPGLALVLNDAIKENFIGGNYYNYRNKAYFRE